MKNTIRILVILLLAFVMVFSEISCQDSRKTENGVNQETASWVDPCAQTVKLTGGTELLPYSGGNKNLAGSPYGYETWDFSQGGASGNKFTWYGANQGGGGAYRADWTGYFLARLGYFWGNGGPYTQYKNIYIDYNYDRTANNTSSGGFIGVYGWSRNPSASDPVKKLIEYYIVDDWFYNTQLGASQIGQGASNVTEQGSFSVDGAVYKIYTAQRVNQPSIDGTKTFTQIFSVRQGVRTSGTISVTEHLKKMNGILPLGNMYEAKFKVETFGGKGNLDLRYLHLTMEDNPRSADKICHGN